MRDVYLATEDALSEAVGIRLLGELQPAFNPPLPVRKGGSGYLRSSIKSWRELARHAVVLVLTDLDQVACPVALRDDWFGVNPPPPQLLLRVAVREIESWVLADHEAVRTLIGKRGKLPSEPDALPDPKRRLLGLAKMAARAVREDLVKEAGAISRQGVGYNNRLSHLVQTEWSPARAAARSPSLRRTRQRLSELAQGLAISAHSA